MTASAAPAAPSFSLDPKVARDFGLFAGGFWLGDSRTRAWLLTFGLAASLLASTGITVAMNHWNRWFFDALEQKDVATVGSAVLVFAAIIAGMAAIGVCIVITRETLQVRWRAWLVERLLGRWLDNQRFYRLNASGTEPPNPEYRISDDTRWATEIMVDLGIGLVLAISGAIAFISILAAVGGSYRLGGVVIPIYMVWVALAYGVTASLLMTWVGRPLVGRVGAKNEAEGYFRFAMMRLRDNAESVALMRGGPAERAIMGRFYDDVVRRWLAIVRSHGQVTWITNSSGPMIPIIPLLVLAPKYLAGDLSLGQVTQLAAAFVQVQVAISWVVDNYNRIAEWYASARRVMDIVYACEAIDGAEVAGATPAGEGIRVESGTAAGLVLARLDIADRHGQPLVVVGDLALGPGVRAFVTGESSAGKTMLVRALAGLWRTGTGTVRLGSEARVMVVPQRAYLPLGSLAEALAYPAPADRFASAELDRALTRVGLGSLVARLAETARWDQLLSAGERQRLAVARVLLDQPDILILDDALSALEEAAQRAMLAAIAAALPRTTVLSLGQRRTADGFHDRWLQLERHAGGARLVPVAAAASLRV